MSLSYNGIGAAHSACLDESGAVLAWRSADPGLHVQEVGGLLAGKRVVSISAGAATVLDGMPWREYKLPSGEEPLSS